MSGTDVPDCLVSFGSNLGDREATIRKAMSLLETKSQAKDFAASSLIETAPVGGEEGQGAFLNGIARFDSHLSVKELHDSLREIEKQLGRERHERWSARTLDLDLIGYGDHVIDTDELRVPHPRMSFRSFVLQPACEVAPDWVHPELGITLAELYESLRNGRNVIQTMGGIAPLVQTELQIMGLNIPVESVEGCLTSPQPARLQINGKADSRGVFGQPGPRLCLADCQTDAWRTEVRAALECVWPMCDNAR